MNSKREVITMADALTREGIKYMIARLLKNPNLTLEMRI